ncbi:MAG TPA: 50S ribosomal protein L6 [Thermoanaerobaculia bacterium]|nr:50S ribosomal protein L6 [Thermoanaerobaculia bacterium]HUM30653.1 50S ribosomal protein L6 [Thermoanaerobaculia bacterium]HXK68939.1 50S ribosomal protein L6 [Thermoanaerobaculia bacterium]
MSRIGKKPIQIPSGVTVTIGKDLVEIQGPKGKMFHQIMPNTKVELVENSKVLQVTRSRDDRQSRAYHGLLRALIANSVTGVSTGFTRKLVIEGVGFKSELKDRDLVLQLGFSHTINFPVPEDITVEVDPKQNVISVSGIDKQRVGQVARNIRELRPPDAYKGKGIRYSDEVIRKKVGKAGA